MKKILIVEDQYDVQKLLGLSLQEENRQILHAYDAEEAWRMMQTERPAVILLDIMMPGDMDGLDLLRQLRQQPELLDTKVIVISALTQSHDLDAAYAAGADDFIAKPFRLDELNQKVSMLLS